MPTASQGASVAMARGPVGGAAYGGAMLQPSSPDPARWERTRGGWVRVPPAACPGCGAAWRHGPTVPIGRPITCSCSTTRHHQAWVCGRCGAWAAEGCRDVVRWAPSSLPVGEAPLELRYAVSDPD